MEIPRTTPQQLEGIRQAQKERDRLVQIVLENERLKKTKGKNVMDAGVENFIFKKRMQSKES